MRYVVQAIAKLAVIVEVDADTEADAIAKAQEIHSDDWTIIDQDERVSSLFVPKDFVK